MIEPLLGKLYGILMEKRISIRLENKGEQAKGQVGFRRHGSTKNHLVMLMIIVKECCKNKSNMFYYFVDFRKYFDTMPRKNL